MAEPYVELHKPIAPATPFPTYLQTARHKRPLTPVPQPRVANKPKNIPLISSREQAPALGPPPLRTRLETNKLRGERRAAIVDQRTAERYSRPCFLSPKFASVWQGTAVGEERTPRVGPRVLVSDFGGVLLAFSQPEGYRAHVRPRRFGIVDWLYREAGSTGHDVGCPVERLNSTGSLHWQREV